MRLTRVVPALLIALLAGTACGSAPSQPVATSSGTQAAATASSEAAGAIRIGLLYPATGPFAAPGKYMKEGLDLYLQQHNDLMAGHKVELFVADSQGQPNTGLTQLRKLVEQDHIQVLLGPLSSAVEAAIVPYIDQHKVPNVISIVGTDDLTQRTPSPYIVRSGWTSSQTTQPLGDYAYKTLGYRKVATVAYDLPFGWGSVGGFMQTFQQDGGKIVKQIWTPTTTTNFQPYLSQIPSNVDAVFISFSGSTAINFIQQYHSFGHTAPLIAQGNTTDESTLTQTGDSAVGVISALTYSAALDNPANKAFVAAYTKAYGHVPSYYSEGTYVDAMFVDQAAQSLHGDFSNPDAVVKALRAVKLDNAPRGPIVLDSYGNPIENVYIRKVEKVNGQLENVVIHTYPKVSQFWTYNPKTFLAHPAYSRTYPACNGC